MTTGVKSYNGSLGVTQARQHARLRQRARTDGTNSLWELAEDAGLATGVISTARFTHATPAAAYAKTNRRDWESDADVSPEGKAAGCTDIASQFVDCSNHGDGFDVALGGGRAQFLPDTRPIRNTPTRKATAQTAAT